MNQILLSFLCGAAFLGGAIAVLVLLGMWTKLKDKSGREELLGYWKSSLAKHDTQLALIERLVVALESKKDK
jgi:hypothetical protein